MYNGCTCAEGAGIIACNDDGQCSIQSQLEWYAQANQEYLIRLGTSFPFQFGSGVLEIAADACPADLNDDAAVDRHDLATLLAHFAASAADHWEGDVDGDTDVDLQDLATLLAAFGTSCP